MYSLLFFSFSLIQQVLEEDRAEYPNLLLKYKAYLDFCKGTYLF